MVSETGFAGTNPGGNTTEVTASKNYPVPGVWEAVVYCSAGLSAYNLSDSDYLLDVSLKGVNNEDLQEKDREIIIGLAPKVLQSGRKNYVTIQVRDRFTKRLFQGFIGINGKIYFTRGGKVTLPVEVDGKDIDLKVSTVPDNPVDKPWEIFFTVPAGD